MQAVRQGDVEGIFEHNFAKLDEAIDDITLRSYQTGALQKRYQPQTPGLSR